jgi:hypothetical protein
MFGLKTRRTEVTSPRSTTRETHRPLSGIFNVLSRRRTTRSDIPYTGVEPRSSQGRRTVSGILRDALRHRKAK